MNIQIREALAGDASFLARSILIAGRAHVAKGIWEIVLNVSESDCLRFLELLACTAAEHLFHYSCSFIAESDDKIPVGSLGGYDPKKSGYQSLQQALPEVYRKLSLPGLDFESANKRASKILACLPKEIENAWVIDSVATMPEYRGRGVAEYMLRAVLDEGKKRGYQIAQVNMYIGNEPALHLYQKLGFTINEETQDTYFEKQIGSPGMLSLTRRI
ncbi:MAG: GNAT family N-acetyltransferase [Deltaproteobacteria bacterium]|nr:MAG: GNAT family N-acetyltransferase [Deltaproteobacteria bacterium]